MTAPVITLNQVDVFYDSLEGEAQAVTAASFTVAARETFGLVGGSGSGKSTLLRVLAGLTPTWRGVVEMGGMRLEPGRAPPKSFHRRVQMVFQDPYGSLHPRRTVNRILSDGLEIHGFDGIEGRVRRALEQVGLDARFLQRYPHELSGGQRQRVAIARALCLEPEILLLDEPTAALDASVQAEILNLLAAIRSGRPVTCIFVSHDLSVVAHCCDTVAVMQRGRIVECLTAEELIQGNVRHPYTRDLLLASEGLTEESARPDAPAC